MSLAKEIIAEFNGFRDSLIERDLLIDSNDLHQFNSKDRTILSWEKNAKLSYLFENYSTIAQFQMIMEKRDFNFCMYDGGIFQIFYDLREGDIFRHRLCYVPCPFHYSSDFWEGYSLSEIPEIMGTADFIAAARLSSPVRFDFDSVMTDKKHAHSHFSFNSQSCRIPAYGPISLGHFFRFIMRYFYELDFDSHSCWEDLKPKKFKRTLDNFIPHEFHIDTSW